jgi:hypothetical protein
MEHVSTCLFVLPFILYIFLRLCSTYAKKMAEFGKTGNGLRDEETLSDAGSVPGDDQAQGLPEVTLNHYIDAGGPDAATPKPVRNLWGKDLDYISNSS